MTKKIDPELAARLREESEDSKKDPYPSGVAGSRPNRQPSLAEEQEQARIGGDANHIPPSTADTRERPDQD
ncbi:hypothetical protein [Tomitella biformata]|uniref:hypothetical protein n=1 Tax=Tomitella biformata TaxID=630403 RepID=UPI0004634A81|nr:hypothetical protein [Tomitella biformata]